MSVPNEESERVQIDLVAGQRMGRADIARMAALHLRELPGSAISRLGAGAAEGFYRFVTLSSKETVLVARIGGQVVACAVLTTAPGSLGARFAGRAVRDWRLAAALMRSVLNGVGRSHAGNPQQTTLAPAPQKGWTESAISPELSLIFTDRECQGRGLGAQLLDHLARRVRSLGYGEYFTRTNASVNNRAIGFYERNGFVRVGYLHAKRKTFLVLRRLTAAES